MLSIAYLNKVSYNIRASAAVKVETDIIATIEASPTGWYLKLVIMYIETFKTEVIVFIGNVIMC